MAPFNKEMRSCREDVFQEGGRRVIRQTEIARKMVGKTEIIQKLAAAGSGN